MLLWAVLSCARPLGHDDVAAPATVAYRPGDPLPALGPDARVDRGLRAAAEELAAGATSRDARLAPGAVRLALARAGYPGDARFLRAVAGPELPPALLDALPHGVPVDVGWAWRDLPGGERWWVVGWAERPLSVDPLRRDLSLDEGVGLRVDGARDPRLLLGRPDGSVVTLRMASGETRWIDRFPYPGEYRVEVVDGDRVALLFSLFVDTPPAAAAPLPGPAAAEPVAEAEAWLYAALGELRSRAGAAPVKRFAGFEPHARAHAACLGAAGVVAHDTARCPGVPALAERTHHPHARHHEDVAAADRAAEAWERTLDSPGHRLNLLCEPCTHASIGAARVDGRLFAVFELLEFPEGEPGEIPRRR